MAPQFKAYYNSGELGIYEYVEGEIVRN